ncbi:sensor histidine kinase [Mongoliitalea daihaiensis]|uniref:sensor histidine kinase n=1 Tax=Mongoliitalea daihaiensis TaxID=2782006 RepID=UPI001F1D2DF3|nr:ATP-binding protein [Mongoliitalea daihaiensis]UJP64487.1 GHKL domain-containing protein [Mongoliitalea daihaiensis]
MNAALKITILYCAFGALWIFFSDRLVLLFLEPSDIQNITYFQTLKGFVYVFLTGVLLYVLVNWFYGQLDDKLEEQKRLNKLLLLKSREFEKNNKDLESFVFSASKDLLEPLRMVTNFLDLFKSKYFVGLDDKAKSYIGFAHEGALNMRTTLFDFLEYSTARENISELTELDLNEILKVIQEKLARKVEEKQAILRVDDLPVVVGHREDYVRIFLNLLDNALKFSKNGIKPKIHVGYKVEGQFFQFFVKDNGMGVSEEFHEEIFYVFRRLSTNQKFQGSGMGLAIVKKILENQGGSCWVESQEGEGCTVYFQVPKT